MELGPSCSTPQLNANSSPGQSSDGFPETCATNLATTFLGSNLTWPPRRVSVGHARFEKILPKFLCVKANVAARTRIVSRPEFGWITGNLCDLSKGYFATTFLSSSLTCPATQSGLLQPRCEPGSRRTSGQSKHVSMTAKMTYKQTAESKPRSFRHLSLLSAPRINDGGRGPLHSRVTLSMPSMALTT